MSTTTLAAPVARKRHLRDHARTGRIVLTGLWADAVLVMASSAYNGGEAFTALHQPQGQGIALGVAVDVALAVALVGDRALHLEDRTSAWGRSLRIVTALMSLALNCGVTLWQGHVGVAIFHAFLPVLLVLLSEYAQDITLQFGEIADEYKAAEKAELDAKLAADRAKWEAEQAKATAPSFATVGSARIGAISGIRPSTPTPVGAAAPPAFRAVPNLTTGPAAGRPTIGPVEQPSPTRSVDPARPAVDPSTRPDPAPVSRPDPIDPGSPTIDPVSARPTGPTQPVRDARPNPTRRPDPPARVDPERKRAPKPKTDEQLLAAARKLHADSGNHPTVYQLRQAFGIGASRATRLLAELDPIPAAEPSHNGAGTRKDGA